MSYMFSILMKEIFVKNVFLFQAYFPGILGHKGRSVDILSESGTEFKNKVLNYVYYQIGIKGSYLGLPKHCLCLSCGCDECYVVG